MREQRFNPKLSVISAAASSIAAPHDAAELAVRRAEQDAILAEVALRLPRKHALRELAVKTRADLDAALQRAVEGRLGEPLTDPSILQGRLEVEAHNGGDHYLLDGVAILWAGPVVLSEEEGQMHANRTLKVYPT